jgi:hypothetical protein
VAHSAQSWPFAQNSLRLFIYSWAPTISPYWTGIPVGPLKKVPLLGVRTRDEKRLKRSHCIQWERNAIVYSGNALTVSRPWNELLGI